MDKVYLDLEHTNGAKLFYKPEKFIGVQNELIEFLNGEKHLCTKTFAKKVMFSHEIKANNQVEGYGDDIEIINQVIKKTEDIKDEKKRKRILNLYHAYNYILKGNKIDQESLKKLYGILSDGLLEETDLERMGEYYRQAPVYILKGGRLDTEPFLGVNEKKINKYMDYYFEFLNKDITGDITDEYIKSQIMHYYFVYIHPYFDVNGRTSRTLAMWHLLNKKSYPYIIFNRGISFRGNDYNKVIEDVRKYNDLSYFITYMLETVKIELEKEYVMQYISASINDKLTSTDYQTLLYFLSMNGLKTTLDFSSIYNRFNDKKNSFTIFEEMIVPLLDKGVLDIERFTSRKIGNNQNMVLKLRDSLTDVDKTKVKKLNI